MPVPAVEQGESLSFQFAESSVHLQETAFQQQCPPGDDLGGIGLFPQCRQPAQ